jgi:hypothetical protein
MAIFLLLLTNLKNGGAALNPEYAGVSTPVLRNPLLFHQNTVFPTPTYYATQRTAAARPAARVYTPNGSSYTSPYLPQSRSHSRSQSQSQSRFPVQAPASYYPQSYPYYPASPGPTIYSPMPFSAYSVPINAYAPTVPSNGLAVILIATLTLVALDLMIVRPLKRQ